MTTTQQIATIADDSQPDVRPVPEMDARHAQLLELLRELDGIGLSALPDSRVFLERADEVVREFDAARGNVTGLRDQLVAAVADGTRGLLSAAVELAEAQSGSSSPMLVRAVVVELRRRAYDAARSAGLDVHRALALIADDAVRTAVEAGRKLVDVVEVKSALKPPALRRQGGVDVHPWVDEPPVLPAVSLEAVSSDSVKLTAWAAASAATEKVGRVLEVASVLHLVMGGSSKLFATDVDENVSYFVGKLPDPVQLAVADGLGWRPGLHLTMKQPAAPRRSRMKELFDATARIYPAGWRSVGGRPRD